MKIALIVLVLACVAYYFYNSASSKKAALLNHEKGSAFLAENSKKEGVKTTASGLQYEVLQSGSGEIHPSASSTVRVHYHGTLTDGTVFDSSVERDETISFPLNRVIPGWTEGLQLMKVGDKFRFFIPSGLGYGNRSAGKIPPGSVLIFDVELFEIQ
ncbi:FKBP-type peptidyl-prolyl cis-trans isomerase [Rheinheimera sp. A13L]|uniref:FKBP-type peptidyl-prolyl cis-trans isomerase n=1 Tax=Rheinheimera sp. A13L TaxID=506534 RepID=UPI0002125503|nr:FKBP-type peptidyl-prolyl cis-trans isomerase [Rheinheimera sp. A13L]EGM76842.1 FKBP-type peptidyl-prolyl cis-trans isomerase [Rheinheimera sp. A13L]